MCLLPYSSLAAFEQSFSLLDGPLLSEKYFWSIWPMVLPGQTRDGLVPIKDF